MCVCVCAVVGVCVVVFWVWRAGERAWLKEKTRRRRQTSLFACGRAPHTHTRTRAPHSTAAHNGHPRRGWSHRPSPRTDPRNRGRGPARDRAVSGHAREWRTGRHGRCGLAGPGHGAGRGRRSLARRRGCRCCHSSARRKLPTAPERRVGGDAAAIQGEEEKCMRFFFWQRSTRPRSPPLMTRPTLTPHAPHSPPEIRVGRQRGKGLKPGGTDCREGESWRETSDENKTSPPWVPGPPPRSTLPSLSFVLHSASGPGPGAAST